MESITIKVEESLASEIVSAMNPLYSTKTEFIREAIRDKIKSINKEKTLNNLEKHFGKYKSNRKDDEVRKEVGEKLLKKYNLD